MSKFGLCVLFSAILVACAPAPVPRFEPGTPVIIQSMPTEAASYTYYLPVTSRPRGVWGPGIASTSNGAYQQQLGAAWFYRWWPCDTDKPDCVPMSQGEVPTVCPESLLVYNEPNSVLPFGTPRSPLDAAVETQRIRAACPDTLLIVGGLALPLFLGMRGVDWAREFKEQGGAFDWMAIHCYVPPQGYAGQCATWIDDFRAAFPDVHLCLTEFGVWGQNPDTYAELLRIVTDRFHCFAAFTDHDPSQSIPYAARVDLVDASGLLTPLGVEYRGVAEGAFWR